MRRLMILAVLLAAALTQGCAIFYATDTTDQNGSVDREFGLLGGCLPLWSYQKIKAEDEIEPQGVRMKVMRTTDKDADQQDEPE